MALMDQNEKNLLLEMAEHYEKRAAHCDIKLAQPGTNEKMYRWQRDRELLKAAVLRKAASCEPDNIKGASPRDAFLWFVCNAWPKFFGDGEVKTIIDHDFGLHVFRLGDWQLELRYLVEFPEEDNLREEPCQH
uniref:Uncharacterized protein n=1 Tax=viral metagenome TaxID=1070528 RepID=A0A6H2A4P2_9ZZZZ